MKMEKLIINIIFAIAFTILGMMIERDKYVGKTISAYTHSDIVHFDIESNRVYNEASVYDYRFADFDEANAFFESQTAMDANEYWTLMEIRAKNKDK